METHGQLLKKIEHHERHIRQVLQEPSTYGKCPRCRQGDMMIMHTSSLYPEGIAYHLRCSHCGYAEVEPFD
jgi:ribosomal protein S27AE